MFATYQVSDTPVRIQVNTDTEIQVLGTNVRMRDDSVPPTASIGWQIKADSVYRHRTSPTELLVVSEGGESPATVNVLLK